MIEAMSESSRTTLVGVLVGLVLLGAVVAFAVVLPEQADGTEAEEAGSPAPATGSVDLPDELPGGLVAVDTGTLPEAVAAQFEIDTLREQEASVEEGLAEVFGVPAAFRIYLDPAAPPGTPLIQLTALAKPPGLYTPDTLPVDPALLNLERASIELVRVGDGVCSITWGQDVPEGQPIDPDQTPQALSCQLGADGRTYEIRAQGITPEDAVDLLGEVAAG